MTEIKTITVKGKDAADAVAQAALHLEGRGQVVTGDPIKTKTFDPRYGEDGRGRPRVWLWKVPIADEVVVPTTTIEYAGLTIKPGREGKEIAWRVLRDGANVMPGATWGRTEEEAMQLADVWLAVEEDSQRFWHLLRAIQRQARIEVAR